MTCPCCQSQLTEAQVKTIWATYCTSRVSPEARKNAKPWRNHNEKAGNRCMCADCIRLREIRAKHLETVKPKRPPITEEELTWDAVLTVDPKQGYETLLKRETARELDRRKGQARRRLNAQRYEAKLRTLKERAKRDGVYAKILKEAKARADAACSAETSKEPTSPTKTTRDTLS